MGNISLEVAVIWVPIVILLTLACLIMAFTVEIREWLLLHVHRISHQKMLSPVAYNKVLSRVKLIYSILIYCTALVFFVLCLFNMQADASVSSMESVVSESLKLSPLDAILIEIFYLAIIVVIFQMSVGSPPPDDIALSMPDEDLILAFYSMKARQSMIGAARMITLSIVFEMILILAMVALPLQDSVKIYFGDGTQTSEFGWIYLIKNLLGDTPIYCCLLYSVSSRYVDNWFIIEDLQLPVELINQTVILKSFQDELSMEDRKGWQMLDLSDFASKVSRANPQMS
jgi:hypothetical protein